MALNDKEEVLPKENEPLRREVLRDDQLLLGLKMKPPWFSTVVEPGLWVKINLGVEDWPSSPMLVEEGRKVDRVLYLLLKAVKGCDQAVLRHSKNKGCRKKRKPESETAAID